MRRLLPVALVLATAVVTVLAMLSLGAGRLEAGAAAGPIPEPTQAPPHPAPVPEPAEVAQAAAWSQPAAAPAPILLPPAAAGWDPGIPVVAAPIPVGAQAGGGVLPAAPVVDRLEAWGPPAAPELDRRRFTEAHWQGLEVVPRTPALAEALGLPPGVPGVIADDVTLPADLWGFEAGDLVTAVGTLPTPDLPSFLRAADAVRDARQTELTLVRRGERRTVVLTALGERLGNANGETASMIPPGARMPHAYRGACVECHRIGTTGTLAVDQGDLLTRTAPPIRAGATSPHRDRGPCEACHAIAP